MCASPDAVYHRLGAYFAARHASGNLDHPFPISVLPMTIPQLPMRPTLCLVTLALVMMTLAGCHTSDASRLQDRPAHHTADGFRNLYIDPIEKGPFTFIKMKYFGDEPFADHEAEAYQVPIADPRFERIAKPGVAPQVTWLGHSTFLIQHQGLAILTDPILSDRASPVGFAGPQRLVEMPVAYEHLPNIDYVIISHNHYDHLDADTIAMLGDQPVYLVPLKLKQWFLDAGISADRVREFDWWDSLNAQDLTVTATPSQHWSARGLFDRHATLWAAWHIQIRDFGVWFGGDTGYNPVQFKQVGERWPDIDLGLIPIGAYAPRWFMSQQHVDPDEAIKIHQDIGAKLSIGMHWGTFQLSAEPMMEPAQRIASAVESGIIPAESFITMAVGETRLLTPPVHLADAASYSSEVELLP